VTARARAGRLFAARAYDPAAAGGLVAWQRPGDSAVILRDGARHSLPGTHPALGGGRIAWREGDAIVVADAATLQPLERHHAPGAGALGVSESLLAWRTRDATGTDRIWIVVLGQVPRPLLEQPAPEELGRPALLGTRLLCHVAGPAGSRLIAVDAVTGAQEVLRTRPGAQVSNPATDGARLLYVHATGRAQELRLGALAPLDPDGDAVVLLRPSAGQRDREHEHGRKRHRHRGRRPPLPPLARRGVVDTLWTTALAGNVAYVTRLRAATRTERTADILRVPIAG
jgi:hypothetical protein